jgi:type I restriction enzyme S subunit
MTKQTTKDWMFVKLGEACEIIMGQSPPSSSYNTQGMGLPFFQGKAEFTNLHPIVEKWCIAPNKIAEPNDILLSVRAPVGATNIANQKCCIGRGLAAIRFKNYKYAFYFLRSIQHKLDSQGTGTTFRAISGEKIRETIFPFPPFSTQIAIVSKIEELFSVLDKGIENLRLAQQQLKTYRQSTLSAGTSGLLTGTNNFYLNSITIGVPAKENNNWKVVKLIDVAKLESGHTPRKDTPAYWENGNVLWLSLQDIRALDGKIAIDTKYKTNELGIENSSARLLPEGTVCFCRDISVGFVTIMGKPMSTTQHFANWICTEELDNKFLMYSFMASRDSLIRQGQGTTVKTIYMPELKEMRIHLPPKEEQRKIVEVIESRLSVADKMEESIDKSLQQAEVLRQSILKKAFEGKLI